MNQFVAIVRRAAVVVAAAALLCGLMPVFVRAQSDTKPAEPSPAPAADAAKSDSTATADSTVTMTTTSKPAKPARHLKAAKAPRLTRAEKLAAAEAAEKARPAKAPKSPKAPRVRAPEKSREEQRKEDGVYAKGSDWLSLRFGYAKHAGDLSGGGLVGYGVGYQHMMSRKFGFAAGAGHDVVGHFGNEIDEAMPFTAELQRHYNWKTAARPYVGLGGGFYLRKMYRTGSEYNTTTTGGPHLSLGITSALNEHHVLGLEARVARLKGRPGIVNPTFGPGEKSETLWTVKVSWALVY